MNRLALVTFGSLSLASASFAAPATRLPAEFVVPFESEPIVAIADIATGQVRLLGFGKEELEKAFPPTPTGIADVSHLATGLFDGAEHLSVSSLETNVTTFLNTNGEKEDDYFGKTLGPLGFIPLRNPGAASDRFVAFKGYEPEGVFIEILDNQVPLQDLLELSGPLTGLNSIVPFRVPTTSTRKALGYVPQTATTSRLVELEISLADTVSISGVFGVFSNELATACEIRGADGRLTSLLYEPGSTSIFIVTHGELGFEASVKLFDSFPFPIGNITALPETDGSTPGLLVTSSSGNAAAYAIVKEGAAVEIIQSFSPPNPTTPFTGLVPISGLGFVALSGDSKDGRSTLFDYHRFNGEAFASLQSGPLLDLLSETDDIATLFWFNDNPFLTPDAGLISLERRADWTAKTSDTPIPASVQLSSFSSSTTGLASGATQAVSAPSGATFLLTSQVQEGLSVSAATATSELVRTPLSISPASGTYDEPLTISAVFDEEQSTVRYREDTPGSPWQVLPDDLLVSYPKRLLFYAINSSTGAFSPIITRDYSFNNYESFDSDGDKVPDYVEERFGLNPLDGADSDGDFYSDLEEILAGTDPNNPMSRPLGATRQPVSLGEGFSLFANATNSLGNTSFPLFDASTTADPDDLDIAGESIRLHTLTSELINSNEVLTLASPALLSGQVAANLVSGTSLERDESIILSTPPTFRTGTGTSPTTNGIEILTVRVQPMNLMPTVSLGPGFPTETNLTDDANEWVSQAQSAYTGHVEVNTIIELEPIDNAIAAMNECVIFDALQLINQEDSDFLTPPPPVSLSEFTLFGFRPNEASRQQLTTELIDGLRRSGFSPAEFAGIIETQVKTNTDIGNLAIAIENAYRVNQALPATDPNRATGMLLPFDAFRSILANNGTIVDPINGLVVEGSPISRPNPYAGINPVLLSDATLALKNIKTAALATRSNLVEWHVIVREASSGLARYEYVRDVDADETIDPGESAVYLTDLNQERLNLDQGLGLQEGTIYHLRGFTDINSPIPGQDAMRVRDILSVITFTPSESDSDANLLDDDWERFYFGDTGTVDPLAPHPNTGHSYLQYFLEGADPRTGNIPATVDIVEINFGSSSILPIDPDMNQYCIQFEFPEAYQDRFTFKVTTSETLDGFGGNAISTPAKQVEGEGDLMEAKLQPGSFDPDANFFRVELCLE